VLITDCDLNIATEALELIIHQSAEIMENMDDWCKEHHGNSGLTASVLSSKVTTSEAASTILSFLKQHIPEPHIAPLAGNSVHFDKLFLEKEMPSVVEHLHYRIVDVSTIKELVRRWYPEVFNRLRKNGAHRALQDIHESIDELKYYRQHCFLPPH